MSDVKGVLAMGKRILVVDDVTDIQKLLVAMLQPSGFEVCTASSGDEDLRILRHQTCDLILLDISMPTMSGLEMLHHLRAEKSTRDLPVIMLTAFNEERMTQLSQMLGADDYLVKSDVNPDDLCARVEACLKKAA